MDSRRSRAKSHADRVTTLRPNMEYFQQYDDWARQQAEERCLGHPCVQLFSRILNSFHACLYRSCNSYLNAHSIACHMIVFFCFLNAVVAWVISYAMRCRIAAFTIPAVHHKWDMNEKAAGCSRAASYYLLFGICAVLMSWASTGSVWARVRSFLCRLKVQPSRTERRTNLLQRNVGRRAAEDSDDYETSELQSIEETGSLHNRSRSGYASSGYSSSVAHDDRPRRSRSTFELGVTGLVPKNRLKLLGIGSSSGVDE